MNEQPESELYAELAALRQRLSHLEAEHEEVQRQAARAHRPAFLRKVLLGPLPLALLVVGGGLLYAQGDALFIDQNGDVNITKNLNVTGDVTTTGNVGIGATPPSHRFHVVAADAVGLFESSGEQAYLRLSTKEGLKNRVEIANRPGGRLSLWTAGGGDVFNITKDGNVGIGTTTPSPSHKFHVVAADAVGLFESSGGQAYLRLSTKEGLENRVEITNRPGGRLSLWTAGGGDVFNITKDGKVGIGTDKPNAKLEVKGNARIDGGVSSMAVYQIDQNDPPKTYEISPRYHLSVMAERFDGTTIPIPKQTLTDLCGDPDGCQVRLGMTRWESNSQTETASRTFLFYYSPNDGHWRSNFKNESGGSDSSGVIGNGIREDAGIIWSTCYFTDGTLVNRGDKGDTKAGMALFVWDGYKNPKRTCELTLID